jgi:hypothetical protein
MVTSPPPYHKKIQALERKIALNYGQTREEHAVKLWLKNAAKSRHSSIPQTEFEAAVFRFMEQRFNSVIKMDFI